jgi:hydroxyacylglutathione hydrolase
MTMNQVIPISIWSAGMINCFLIQGSQKHVLVDTGLPGSEQKILKQLHQHGINPADIGLIIITHAHIDHFGSAARLQQLLKVPILAHQLDSFAYRNGQADVSTLKPNKPQWQLFKWLIQNQKTIPFQPDILLEGPEEYDLRTGGVQGKVIHTPGHTPGSLSVILDHGQVIMMDMMASGILLGGLLFHSRVKHPPFHDDLPELKRSFDKVLAEKGDRYYLGHGGPVNRAQVVEYYEQYLKNLPSLPRHG